MKRTQALVLGTAAAAVLLLFRHFSREASTEADIGSGSGRAANVQLLERSREKATGAVRARGSDQEPAAKVADAKALPGSALPLSTDADVNGRDVQSTYSGLLEAWEQQLRESSASVSLAIGQLGSESDPEVISILENVLRTSMAAGFAEADTSNVLRIARLESLAALQRQAALSVLSALPSVHPWHALEVAQIARGPSAETVIAEAINTLGKWQRSFPDQADMIAAELFLILAESESETIRAQAMTTLSRSGSSLTQEQIKLAATILTEGTPSLRIQAGELIGSATGPNATGASEILRQADRNETDPSVKRMLQQQLARTLGAPPQR